MSGYPPEANHLVISKTEETRMSKGPPSIQNQDGTDGGQPLVHSWVILESDTPDSFSLQQPIVISLNLLPTLLGLKFIS